MPMNERNIWFCDATCLAYSKNSVSAISYIRFRYINKDINLKFAFDLLIGLVRFKSLLKAICLGRIFAIKSSKVWYKAKTFYETIS